MLRDSLARFAQEKIGPKVRQMDEASKMDPSIWKDMFAQGLMGIEVPTQYKGSGLGFTSAIITIGTLFSRKTKNKIPIQFFPKQNCRGVGKS